MAIRTETPISARGLLEIFSAGGVLELADVQVAQTLTRLSGEADQRVQLALALLVRAVREGSVCINPLTAAQDFPALVAEDAADPLPAVRPELPWPEPGQWLSAVEDSVMVARAGDPLNQRATRLVDGQLYLERYWADQDSVVESLLRMIDQPAPIVDEDRCRASLERLFGSVRPGPGGRPVPADVRLERQCEAVDAALHSWFTVLAGGPGTGKTSTIGKLLVALSDQSPGLRVALTAPTGKAAARLSEALGDFLAGDPRAAAELRVPVSSTVHALLGARPRSASLHNASHPLPHDLVICDEASMLSLPMVAQLLRSLAPGTRLVLIGDPDQLASVEAGAVLADIVAAAPPRGRADRAPAVTTLIHNFRNTPAVQQLAAAVRGNDPQATLELLDQGADSLVFWPVDPAMVDLELSSILSERILAQARAMREAARQGLAGAALAELDRHRLVCAHRAGPYGVSSWVRAVETMLRRRLPGYAGEGEWYWGRPILIGSNDRVLGINNGDSGVIVRDPRTGGALLALAGPEGRPRLLPPHLVDAATLHAMTIHKSQGSQFDQVSLVLPPVGSPLLTRELFYTAITRARLGLLVIGTPESVRGAVTTPARRASGLTARLRAGLDPKPS